MTVKPDPHSQSKRNPLCTHTRVCPPIPPIFFTATVANANNAAATVVDTTTSTSGGSSQIPASIANNLLQNHGLEKFQDSNSGEYHIWQCFFGIGRWWNVNLLLV